MASPAVSLSKIKAATKKLSVGVLDRVPWFEKEPDGSVAAATDEALLEGSVDPESLSRDELYVCHNNFANLARLLPYLLSSTDASNCLRYIRSFWSVAGKSPSAWPKNRWPQSCNERKIKIVYTVPKRGFNGVFRQR
jgi:hypothetical protein